jgi:hypothetical protein
MLYNSAVMLNIDLIMLILARNYWNSIGKVLFNSLIPYLSLQNDQYFDLSKRAGYLPCRAFIYLDLCGSIQDESIILIIYHHY